MTRKKRRRIVVVTGTRAEAGLLEPVARAIKARGELELVVVVGGLHLTMGTWREVEKWGIGGRIGGGIGGGVGIDAKVVMQKKGEYGRGADVAALGRGVVGFGKAFVKQGADVILVLGDRIEALAAAMAGSVGGLHVAHIHGGDRAEGVADEGMRHAISKMSHLHFAATSQSRRRLIRMGEDKCCVFNVGSPAVDGLKDMCAARAKRIREEKGARESGSGSVEVIVLQHPIGGSADDEEKWMRGTLRATGKWRRMVVGPNGDAGREGIWRAIRGEGVEVVEHLPRERWLSLLAGAKVLVGNSSAGLIEAAVLRVPVVNVGSRQGGRERAGNVIDCDYGEKSVHGVVKKAMKMDLARMRHPYGKGDAGERIADMLATVDLADVPLRKRNAY